MRERDSLRLVDRTKELVMASLAIGVIVGVERDEEQQVDHGRGFDTSGSASRSRSWSRWCDISWWVGAKPQRDALNGGAAAFPFGDGS